MMRLDFLIIAVFLLSSCGNSSKNDDSNKNIERCLQTEIEDTLHEIQVVDTLELLKNNKRAGKYWFASWDSLYGSDLMYIPPSELRIMRNEIYARYGYIFKSQEMQDYFMEQDWYKPLYSNVDNFLKSIEKHNINFIMQHENLNEELEKEEVFSIFINYVEKKELAPRVLSFKFGEQFSFSLGDPAPTYSAFDYVFQKEKEAKYLLYSLFAGCNDCEHDISINKYSNQGEMISTYNLGYTNFRDSIFMQNDSVLKCIMTTYNSKKQHLDTTILLLNIGKNGEIIELK